MAIGRWSAARAAPERPGAEPGLPFADRVDAGQRLAARLGHLAGADVVVLALPRGGVPVGAEVARALGAPLEVIVVRKLGLPGQRELAMGAVGEDGTRVLNLDVLALGKVSPDRLAEVEARERAEVARRAGLFRGDRPPVPVTGRTAVVVDDGVATGSSARAACQVARALGAARVVLAVPVAPAASLAELARVADQVVVVATPEPFVAVGQGYRDFRETSEAEAVRRLARGAGPREDLGPQEEPEPLEEEIELAAGQRRLPGRLTVPVAAAGLVVFVHGSGSNRASPRNEAVAEDLQAAGLATLLVDLLTAEEAADGAPAFDVERLAERLGALTADVRRRPSLAGLPYGYFGSSTGAAAALWAAAEDPGVGAVVSRGGRPDLAAGRLELVRAPTLLIVGGRDGAVFELNRQARSALAGPSALEVVPGAGHLFEEPGTLARVGELAAGWFRRYLR